MKKLFHISVIFGLMAVFVSPMDSFAATKSSTKKQSAIQTGTKVRAKVETSGIYDQECYEKYYGCMDNFCIADNENGGTCTCSDESKKYEADLEEIRKTLAEAERISTEEVERVQAGANADIIFGGGERIYNKDGSVAKLDERQEQKKVEWTSIFEEEDEEEYFDEDEFADKTGRALYDAADRLCREQMPSSCSKDMKLLTQMYSRQIVSDCKGLANSITQKKQEANAALKSAQAAVRGALKDSFAESNKYDRGTCMVEFKKCMRSEDACGSDWGQCVFTVAAENMQNNAAVSTAGTKVKTIKTYDITASTMEILESKRFICERVLDNCVAVRDYVWDDFLRESAPTIRLAESNIESQKRQSCLGDISNCIQKACKDDIAGKGVATMDACLSRPDMARSFCKVQIDPCERMEPAIWDYVVAKLAAMRVDACTKEVKDCFTSEDRCGSDFSNCIGMDFNYIHDICPIDKLVVCKQNNKNFSMSDLDSMLMGLYLNIDNKALENCQKIAEEKMVELCGSTTDCNTFAADEYIGAGSVRSQKQGNVYRVTGMISFGSIKIGDAMGTVKDEGIVLQPGVIGVQDYITEITAKNKNVPNSDAIISSIEEELNNVAGTINRTISILESDQQIQYCINGRDLSQINGKGKNDNTTVARFPNLLNQYRTAIGLSALRKAQDNYNKKVAEEVAKATKDASVDIAQYMCQILPTGNNINTTGTIAETPLSKPYSIVYEVSGISNADLTKNNSTTQTMASATLKTGPNSEVAEIISSVNVLAPKGVTTNIPGGTKTVRSSFNRESRMCHVCTEFITRECKQKGIGLNVITIVNLDSRKLECGEEHREETCEDIPM